VLVADDLRHGTVLGPETTRRGGGRSCLWHEVDPETLRRTGATMDTTTTSAAVGWAETFDHDPARYHGAAAPA
jgi:hypothetical protein